ncbi:DUF3515 family protein [Streptomyces sp. ID01-12c]|uniref:DUF3515 family protein n=1 Tax=Streptomyces caniscabiei TaxID=2746961 RepID=UPI00177F3A49|nr:DUF3515 family protein [Streptomyces caniscabiei]MBD9701743.1 DUF3515 family protein [Streptomyces caniscabiei]MDX3726439.1 DUF3515 family protein [Streptomyces caniscabiei]
MRRPSRRAGIAIGTALGAVAVAVPLVAREVSSPALELRPAARAADPACARIADRYPDRVAGESRDPVSVTGVTSWGNGGVVLRCGLEPPDETVDPCVEVDGVDWVFREDRSTGSGYRVLITYGRDPAVQAFVDDRITAIDGVLVDLSDVVRPIGRAPDDTCVSTADATPR